MGLFDFLLPKAPPAPAPVNAGQAAQSFVEQMANPQLQGTILNAEQAFRPQYNQLNLSGLGQYLFGQQQPSFNVQAYLQARPDILANFQNDPGYQRQYGSLENYALADAQGQGVASQFTSQGQSPGIIGLQGQAAQQLQGLQGQLNTQQRASDLADVEAMGGRASAAFMNANPQLAAQLQSLQGMSQSQGATGYSPQQVQAGPMQGFQAVSAGQPGFERVQAQNMDAARIADIERVAAGQINQGMLGQSLYGQAMNAGPSAISQQLEQRGLAAIAQGGRLTGEEQRSLQQSVRSAYGARGNLGGSQAVSAEALARLSGEREREMQNLSLASGINQQLMGELAANRGFSTGVYGQELGRQGQNVGNTLQADLANQGTAAQRAQAQAQLQQQAALANQAAAMQAQLANQSAGMQMGQFGAQQSLQAQLANQAAGINQGQFGAQMGLQAGLANQAAGNRASEFGIQSAQNQTAADRAFGLNLAGAYGQYATNPFQAVLGSSSGALGAAGQQLGMAGGLQQQGMGPQLFDPNAGINLGLQNAANLGNYNASTYGARAGATGQIVGGLFQAAGSILGGR